MLAEKGSRFLTGETLCCFDCELMPKLQHVRVAGEFPNFNETSRIVSLPLSLVLPNIIILMSRCMLVFCIIISMTRFYDDSGDEYGHKKKIVKSLNKDHYLEGWP